MSEVEKKGYCTLCRSRCGTVNVVEGETLVAVRPDSAHPTGKAMCLKGKAAPELVHSAERILYPMRRTSPKDAADPGWVRISWEEALDEIAGRLVQARATLGAESVAFAVTTPSGTPLSDSIDWIERLVRLYGSPNTCYATEICNWHKDFAHAFTFGCGMPTADYRNAGLILLWGHNPTNTWLSQAEAIGAGRAAGARLIVVDPRQTSLAADADQWLRVKPGSDTALAMALANLMIEANAFDIDFVRQWTNGPMLVRKDNGAFLRGHDIGLDDAESLVAWDARGQRAVAAGQMRDEPERFALRGTFAVALAGTLEGETVLCQPAFDLYAAECACYPADRAAALTWIAEGDIRHAASMIGAARSVAYHAWSGVGQHENATQTDRAIACLYALTGSFDRRGGNRIYRKPPFSAVSRFDLLHPDQARKALGLDERPLGPPAQGWVTARDLYRAITDKQPYAVTSLVAFGTNLLLSQPDVAMGEQALRELAFYVHCDLFENPSAKYADILLPVNTPWEREGLRIGFEVSAEAEQLVQLRQRMVAPRGEARSDNDIVFDLATRIGLGEAFFGGSLEAGWDYMLAPMGLTVAALRRSPEGVRVPVEDVEMKYRVDNSGRPFNTPTGLVELYSERLLRHGYPPLPGLPASACDDGKGDWGPFPYLMTSAKNGYYCHSQQRGVASLRRKAMLPQLDISAEIAAARAIRSGDPVRVTTPSGSAVFTARVHAGLHPAVVVGEYGWWQRCDAMGQDPIAVRGAGSANFNGLIDARRQDPISGSSPLRSYRCRVERETGFDIRRRRWEGFRPFRVVALHKEAADVTTVRMAPVDGCGLPDFLPGQHATVKLFVGAERQEVIRSYSMTGPSAVPRRRDYSISVRHAKARLASGEEVSGFASSFINTRLAVGDIVELRAPGGSFVMPTRTARPLVLVAGGIGMTPFINLLESLVGRQEPPTILLLYANQNGSMHAFRHRIRELEALTPTLKVVNFYDAPVDSDVPGKDFQVHGRVSADAVPDSLLALRPLIYMCGPPAMMTAFAEGMTARGIPRFDIHREIFRSPALPRVEPGQAFLVRFRKSNVSHAWRSELGPLLGFAEARGICLPSGCRVGQCESCAVRIVSGSVHHLHGEAPDDAGVCLACQAVPASDLVLDA
ncbi:molybdopterin-dependent oxidoreductase (plasmid) [Cupriavidus sp. P-10]|uniref:molybdopterin-dependent oxidoreductase n=1 Tax=Cupriavidus sp. P-10 TaxID=2027911 RepID=UPI000E2E57F7|nr:molybdopterin-dependent oxidoreductase [Cupriavidus sp. P-10]BDB28631.1 molybdopterin-dependent oxidoreductase [Cupriavidus sp. P-10]